jgi:hypothetical protein
MLLVRQQKVEILIADLRKRVNSGDAVQPKRTFRLRSQQHKRIQRQTKNPVWMEPFCDRTDSQIRPVWLGARNGKSETSCIAVSTHGASSQSHSLTGTGNPDLCLRARIASGTRPRSAAHSIDFSGCSAFTMYPGGSDCMKSWISATSSGIRFNMPHAVELRSSNRSMGRPMLLTDGATSKSNQSTFSQSGTGGRTNSLANDCRPRGKADCAAARASCLRRPCGSREAVSNRAAALLQLPRRRCANIACNTWRDELANIVSPP